MFPVADLAWSINSSKELVRILIDNKDEYSRPMLADNFWTKVSLELAKEKYYFSEVQCEKRMNKVLRPMLKEFLAQNHSWSQAPWLTVMDRGTVPKVQESSSLC